MAREPTKPPQPPATKAREQRLATALRANLLRRKAQSRARAEPPPPKDPPAEA